MSEKLMIMPGMPGLIELPLEVLRKTIKFMHVDV